MNERELIQFLKKNKYTVTPNSGRRFRHYIVRNPEGRVIATLAKTASDHRTLLNSLADLRRAGVDIPRK